MASSWTQLLFCTKKDLLKTWQKLFFFPVWFSSWCSLAVTQFCFLWVYNSTSWSKQQGNQHFESNVAHLTMLLSKPPIHCSSSMNIITFRSCHGICHKRSLLNIKYLPCVGLKSSFKGFLVCSFMKAGVLSHSISYFSIHPVSWQKQMIQKRI